MKGSPLNFLASPDGDTIRILNLVGQSNEDEDLVTASYIKDDGDEVPVGYLNLVSYESQPFNVVIVPVDGEFKYTASALQSYLDKVYSPAFVSWTVDVAGEPLEVEYDEGEANGLNTSRTLVSKFNAEMKAIIKAMEKRGDYKSDDHTYYLFVMNKAENENLNGLMPFNSNYGFLFTGDNPGQDKLSRTAAHELGPGVFKLRHNFDQIKGLEPRSTQNLMDYTNTPESATVLRKFQWDEINSPRAIAFGWSEEKYAEVNYWGEGINTEVFKEKEGNDFKYPYATKGFELFLSTSYGKKWFLDHAKEGDHYEGEFLPIEIKAQTDGNIYRKNVRVIFNVASLSNSMSDAETGHYLLSENLILIYTMSPATAKGNSKPFSLIYATNKWSHEIFYHGNFTEKQFFKAKVNNFKNIDVHTKLPFWDANDYDHKHLLENTAFGQYGMTILKEARHIIYSKDYIDNLFINNSNELNNEYWARIQAELSDPPSDELIFCEPFLYGLPNNKDKKDRILAPAKKFIEESVPPEFIGRWHRCMGSTKSLLKIKKMIEKSSKQSIENMKNKIKFFEQNDIEKWLNEI